MKRFLRNASICIGTMACSYSMSAQAIYKIDNTKATDMKLSGTSTLHKWDMDASTFTGGAQFGFNPDNAQQLTSIDALNFSLVVLNLKSKEKKLDKNAYKALKTDNTRALCINSRLLQ